MSPCLTQLQHLFPTVILSEAKNLESKNLRNYSLRCHSEIFAEFILERSEGIKCKLREESPNDKVNSYLSAMAPCDPE
jgi:hypothetical protein